MKFRRKFTILFLIFMVLNLTACTNAETDDSSISAQTTVSGELSAWTAYWDIDEGIKEISKITDKLSSISAFALYFNADGSLYVPEKISEKYSSISDITSKNNVNLYTCIVNDVMEPDGTIVQKDSNIIRKLLSSPQERARHINDLVSYAKNNGYFGIEIDYEKLDDDVWPYFTVFCQELHNECVVKKLDVRVILEPKAPVDRYTLPDGPEYIMMAYNLYGLSTEAGPKADVDFIKALAEKMNNVSGKKWFAFATGGFDWETGGEVTGITEVEALDLINVYSCIPARDEKSGCLYFYYTDSDGKDHTVWYADNITFDLWIETAKECGYNNIYLWKLGGNMVETLKQMKENFIK